jgi:hypothetical protein
MLSWLFFLNQEKPVEIKVPGKLSDFSFLAITGILLKFKIVYKL